MKEHKDGHAPNDETVEILTGASALEAVDRAQIDVQVATAKQFPRSVSLALREATELATMDEETAASMFYALPRGGKSIEGPSARLAEVMAYSWGNLRADADIVAEDRTHVTAMGTCFDLEKNVAVRVRVKRRITNSSGVRYNEDMIGVTSNAAISIALRNAVFKVIPHVFANRIYQEARRASIGKAGTLQQKRTQALEWFGKAGVSPDQVYELLGVAGLEDIGLDEIVTLRGTVTALKDGETTVEQLFHPGRSSEGSNELNQAIDQKAEESGATVSDRPATKAQIKQLEGLLEKARSADLVELSDEESISEVVEAKDRSEVLRWNQELSKRLAKAADADSDDQSSLLDEEA